MPKTRKSRRAESNKRREDDKEGSKSLIFLRTTTPAIIRMQSAQIKLELGTTRLMEELAEAELRIMLEDIIRPWINFIWLDNTHSHELM